VLSYREHAAREFSVFGVFRLLHLCNQELPLPSCTLCEYKKIAGLMLERAIRIFGTCSNTISGTAECSLADPCRLGTSAELVELAAQLALVVLLRVELRMVSEAQSRLLPEFHPNRHLESRRPCLQHLVKCQLFQL
jgi:hypothetical protein